MFLSLRNSGFRSFSATAGAALLCFTLAGCTSANDKAIDQARQQAGATGQAQQVITNDGKGNIVTTTVQPPDPTTKAQAVTTTTATTAPAPTASSAAATPAPGAPSAAAAIPAPNQPIIKPADVQIPAGTALAIRINQHISVKTTPAGSHFTGQIAESIVGDNNQVIVPRGTPVSGVVAASHKRGHFKGASILSLQLTSMTLNGTEYPIDTRSYTRTNKGKGKRSAAIIGGTAGAGMLIGGIASGGVGLLLGGLAGGGAGTAVAGLTGNGDIDLPAESLVRFKLADDLAVAPAPATSSASRR